MDNRNKPAASLAALCLMAALLAGCSSVKQELGMGRNSPDEFMVVKRAPLTLPPDYDLRAPSADNVPPASDAANQAKAALTGGETVSAEKGTADQALLGKLGAGQADPHIRSEINRENGMIELENRSVVDRLLFWKEQNPEDAAQYTVVDPKAEADRLKKNDAEGKPANDGDVPVIEKKRSTIDRLF